MRSVSVLLLAALAVPLPSEASMAPIDEDANVFGDGYDLATAEFGYADDDFGYEYEDEDEDEEDEGDFGDEDYDFGDEGDDIGEEDDEFGALSDRIRRRRRRAGRVQRRGNYSRAGRIRGRNRELQRRRGHKPAPSRKARQQRKPKAKLMKAILSLGGVVAAAGATSQQVVVQHDFFALDMTFAGSAALATVTSVFFGDTLIFTNSVGVDVSVFAVSGFMRSFLKGSKIRAGLTITINGTVNAAGDAFKATLVGWKPSDGRC